jgi:hypothetical protein
VLVVFDLRKTAFQQRGWHFWETHCRNIIRMELMNSRLMRHGL